MTWLAIVAIHTAANEPPKVRQVMNKIHRNVAVRSSKARGLPQHRCARQQRTSWGSALREAGAGHRGRVGAIQEQAHEVRAALRSGHECELATDSFLNISSN